MAEEQAEDGEEPKKKKGLKPLLLGLVLLLVGGGAGFGIVASGLLGGGHESAALPAHPTEDVEFVPIDPLLVTVGTSARTRHLRFQAQLEVSPQSKAAVVAVLPRVVDILNSYLRAVELADIENPASLVKLRAQMLRRIQIVVGDGMVSDLLVSEFVLN